MFAVLNIKKIAPDSIVAFFPADHIIKKENDFRVILKKSISYLRKSRRILTVGIEPTRPEVGYGYIMTDGLLQSSNDIFPVKKFVEKPSLKTARKFLKSGKYLWNAGMFIANVDVWIDEFSLYAPRIFLPLKKYFSLKKSIKNLSRIYNRIPALPIDKAIIEKSKRISVIPAALGWSDIGSWLVAWDILKDKRTSNAILGDNIFLNDTRGCIIYTDNLPIVASGVNNLVIVRSKDILLVMDKSSSQELNNIVEYLGKNKFFKNFF